VSEDLWPFAEKHGSIGKAKDSNYLNRLRAAPRISWSRFIDGLTPTDGGTESKLRNLLGQLAVPPSLYWYPGSGEDLRPLVLDVPNNAIGRRLFRSSDPDLTGDPVIFVMNDYSSYIKNFPDKETQTSLAHWPSWWLPKDEQDRLIHLHYQWKGWGRYRSTLSIGELVERYVYLDRLPVTIFTVNVTNHSQGVHDRPESGDTYVLLFFNVPSHVLFEEFILPLRLHVTTVLLSKQGGFSSQLWPFEQYEDVPNLLSEFEPELGPVDLYLIDAYGQDLLSKAPLAKSIRHYEYIGGPVKIGWHPCRAFGRPGLHYNLTLKPKGYIGEPAPGLS